MRTLWVVCGCAALSLSLSGPALACMNGSSEGHLRGPSGSLFADEDELIAELKLAEEALRTSNYSLAAAQLDKLRRMGEGSDGLRSRYARVAALVTVRTGGQWPLRRVGRLNREEERVKALKKAVQALRARANQAPKDPVRQSDLGEGLSSLPQHQKEAQNILEALAKADLLTSAHAYDALARLRAKAGDDSGAQAARTRCKELDASQHACGDAPKA